MRGLYTFLKTQATSQWTRVSIQSSMHVPAPNQYDVIVIGAGMSGLAAARSLAESGLRVLILEAQQRIGGRIYTLHHGSEVIELGAEFIHGQPEDLWALIQEANLETYERTGDFLQAEAGHLATEDQDDSHDPIEALTRYEGPDQSFADFIAQQNLSPDQQAEATAYVEGFNAADAREASIIALGRQQIAEDAIEGDRVWRIKDGYDQLPNYLRTRVEAAGGTLILGARVTTIEWSRQSVLIRTDTAEFSAPKAVITLPLGVLQSNTVRFAPPITEALQAATQMRMGQARRLTLLFKRRLWPEDMSFLIARTAMPPVWWTAYPSASLTITGWVGGPRTAQLATLTQEELIQTACTALAQALNLSAQEIRAELADLWTHDWSQDPHTQGAYSWVPVNGIAASSTLSQPVEDTLYFAGEHTDTTGHWGTVHAALRTGIRAATQILESLS